MLQKSRFFAASLVLLLAIAPTQASAWPIGKLLHLHPRAVQEQDPRLTVQLYNKSGLVQKVRVAGQIYTLLPHDGLTIKAPEGTEVFAESAGFKHRKGDVLFAFTAKLNGDTVTID